MLIFSPLDSPGSQLPLMLASVALLVSDPDPHFLSKYLLLRPRMLHLSFTINHTWARKYTKKNPSESPKFHTFFSLKILTAALWHLADQSQIPADKMVTVLLTC